MPSFIYIFVLSLLLSVVPAEAREEKLIGYTKFNAEPLQCDGMNEDTRNTPNCKTKREKTYPSVCEAPWTYENGYSMGFAAENSDKPPIPFKVYTLAIPRDVTYKGPQQDERMAKRKGGEAGAYDLVLLYADARSGRIVRYSVEHRRPPEEAVEGNPVIDDPRVELPQYDGSFEARLSPRLNGKTAADQGKDFDFRVSKFIGEAQAHKCFFAKNHKNAQAYDADPQLASVNSFLDGSCDDKEFPCCGEGDPNDKDTLKCRVNLAIGTGDNAKNLASLDETVTAANADFNLEMSQKLREGLLTTQAGLIASTTIGVDGIESYPLGLTQVPGFTPTSCNSSSDENRDERFKLATAALTKTLSQRGKEAEAERKYAEWQYNRQTVMDVIEEQWSMCFNKAWAITGGYDMAEAHHQAVLNRNRLLGLIGESGRYDLYKMIKTRFQVTGLDQGFNWDLLENRKDCTKPETEWEWKQLIKRIESAEPRSPNSRAKPSPLFDAIMDADGPTGVNGITGAIRYQKRHALGELRQQIDSTTADCADAATEYEARLIRSSKGLALWKNRALVEAVVRDYLAAGKKDELARFQYLYCKNKKSFKKKEDLKTIVVGGATLVAIFLPGAMPISAASATMLATGLAATTAVAGTVIEVRGLIEKYDEVKLAKMVYDAQVGGAEQMEQVQKEFYNEVITAGLSLALSGIDVYQFAKLGARSIKAGRLLNSQQEGFYKIATKALKEKKLPASNLKQLMRSCSEDDCTEAVMRLTGLLEKNGAFGAMKGAAKADPLPAAFKGALARDEMLMSTVAKGAAKTKPKMFSLPLTMPGRIKDIARRFFERFTDLEGFGAWLVAFKKKVGEKMMERIAWFKAHGLTKEAEELEKLLAAGKVDRGIFREVVEEEASRLGWGRFKEVKGSPLDPAADKTFYATMKDGDLFDDMNFAAGVGHGRESHILQSLYGAGKMKPGEGPDLIRWIGSNPQSKILGQEKGSSVWANLFDDAAATDLRNPVKVTNMASSIMPMH